MKNIFDEYKEKICTVCEHYGDNSFQDCEIRECVDGTIKCCKYKNRKIKNERNNSIKQH